MYIVIGGGGQVGYYLAKGLIEQGHEVVLLEKDSRRVERLAEELSNSIVRGDACEARTLAEVGASRANPREVAPWVISDRTLSTWRVFSLVNQLPSPPH